MYFLKPDTTMKKIVYAGLALGLMTVVSCQKELTEGQMENTVAQITKTMYVEGNEWIPEADTRTAYEPGVGIDWTGNETFAIYYGDPDKAATATSENKYMQKATDVTALGGGKYSFKHEDLGIGAYDYSVIVPDIATTGLQGAGKSATFKLSPVQTPGANTYDPNYDILFGQGAFGVAPAEELEITKFKRVTAPLRLSLSDGAGVIGDEKIHAATISFSQAAAGQNGFAGTLYLNFGYEYEDCKVNSFTAPSSSVTAVYAEGLSKDGSIWPVWYSVHPATFDAGGELTVTVTTETKTVSRTITLASAASIQADILNNLAFDISGEGYTVENTIYQDFTYLQKGNLPTSFLASDGKAYTWSFTNCQVAYDTYNGLLPNGLRSNKAKATITLPDILGKDIVKIRLYAYPNNGQKDNTITLNGGSAYEFNSYADNTFTGNSGILEIDVPEDQIGKSLVLTTGESNFTAFSAMSFVVEDNGEEIPEVEDNDYYSLYESGETIVIDGEEYNIATHGTPILHEDINALTFDDIKSKGVHFIDNSGQSEEKVLTGTALANETVLIGRYKNSQPILRFLKQDGNPGQMSIRSKVVFKNIHVVSNHGTSMFCNSGAKETAEMSLVLDDCTLTCEEKCPAVIMENHTTASFESVVVNNCIIEYATANSNVFAYPTSKVTEDTTIPEKTVFTGKNISIKNCVVYAKTQMNGGLVSLGTNNYHSNSTDIDILLENNTLYNISASNTVARAYIAKSLTVKNNVAYYIGSAKSYLTAIYDTANFPASNAVISGNYLYTDYVENTNFWSLVHTGSFKTPAPSGNFLHSDAIGCISTDAVNLETGHIPVNTSVVTNGAGADYDTKYWVVK